MRNANEQDVARAKATGKLEENVMYATVSGSLVHGKRLGYFAQACAREYIKDGEVRTLVENDDGVIFLISVNELCCHQKKGPAQQPKKPRRKPVRGTRPEMLLEMFPDVKLEVGDKVLIKYRNSNGKIRGEVVNYIYNPCIQFKYAHGDKQIHRIFFKKGKDDLSMGYEITHKILPYQEPVKEEKSPEQEAFEAGYWVAHTALPDSQVPSFTKYTDTEVLFADGSSTINYSHMLNWSSIGPRPARIIVAYRKAQG